MARIFLAEDDESLRIFLTRSLERVGHEVEVVGDGFEACLSSGTASSTCW